MKKDKSRYFGPYTSAGAVKDTIELLRKVYKIRSCQRNLPRDIGKERPCLNYHIHPVSYTHLLRHHGPGDLCRLLDIIGSACGHRIKNDLFCRTATHTLHQTGTKLILGT